MKSAMAACPDVRQLLQCDPYACRRVSMGSAVSAWRQTRAHPACRCHVLRALIASGDSRARGAQVRPGSMYLPVTSPGTISMLPGPMQGSIRNLLAVSFSQNASGSHADPSRRGGHTHQCSAGHDTTRAASRAAHSPYPLQSASVQQFLSLPQYFAGHGKAWRQVQRPTSAAKRSSGPTPSSGRRTCASIDRQGSAELSVKGDTHLPEAD